MTERVGHWDASLQLFPELDLQWRWICGSSCGLNHCNCPPKAERPPIPEGDPVFKHTNPEGGVVYVIVTFYKHGIAGAYTHGRKRRPNGRPYGKRKLRPRPPLPRWHEEPMKNRSAALHAWTGVSWESATSRTCEEARHHWLHQLPPLKPEERDPELRERAAAAATASLVAARALRARSEEARGFAAWERRALHLAVLGSQPACPECEKLKAVSERSQAIGEFIDWLASERRPRITLCVWSTDEQEHVPAYVRTEALLAEFFEIDLQKVEEERRALLEWVRAVQVART